VTFDGLIGLTEMGVELAETVQRPVLTGAVADPPAQSQRLLKVFAGRLVSAQQHLDVAEAGQYGGLAGLVTGLPEQCQRLLVVVSSRLEVAQPLFDVAQVAEATAWLTSVPCAHVPLPAPAPLTQTATSRIHLGYQSCPPGDES
jgi:hypothetical protein